MCKNKPNNIATIEEDGNYYGPALYSPIGQFVGIYSRRRDAVRGAKRRGWIVA